MKKLFLCIIIIMAIPLLSCSDEEPAPPAAIDFVGGQGGQDVSSLNFSHQSSTQSVVFSSNYDWTATPSDEWIKVTPESGKAGEKCEITISLDANDTYEKRSGSIVINAQELNVVLAVSQEQNNAIILSTPTVNLPQAGGAFTVKLKANIDYEYEIKADWIKSVETRALTEHSLRFEAKANPSYDERKGEIVIKGDGFRETVTVTQAQTAFISLSTTEQNFDSEGGTFEVEVEHGVDYDVKISADWVTQIESCAIETPTLRFAVAENTTEEKRTATITISGGNITEVITVSQDRLSPQNNELYYTSSDGKIIEPYQTMGFSANIVSNTYSNGRGVIVFDKAITAISEYAFYECSRLTSVHIPNSIKKIREYAFYDSGLTNIEIPNNVTEIATYAFCSTDIVNLIIPDSVTTIGENTFYGCESLTSITIPDSVTSIGNYAFYGCSKLTSITIPDSVTSIGERAFSYCTGELIINSKGFVETNYTDSNCPTNDSSNGWLYGSKFTKLTIGNSVTSIGDYAFSDCTSLISVTIPDSVTSIGKCAFYDCDGLKSITIPNSVTSIGKYTFYGCESLTSITIPDSVTSIGDYTFRDCSKLTSITIPDNVTSIGIFAFSDCTSLISVTIPNSVTSIGDYTFYGCSKLTSVTIPDSVTSIGWYTFYECTSLTSVTIPDSVTSIGNSAFCKCTSLRQVYCKPTTPPAIYHCHDVYGGYYMSFTVNSNMKIYVPRNSYDDYMQYSSYRDGMYQTNWYIYEQYIEPYDFE